MRILLLGSSGQVGYDLASRLRADSRSTLTALDRTQLDLAELDKVRSVVRTMAPEIVINAAAYTAVDRAESEPELARTINARLPEALAAECKKLGSLLVHYSTDYVFDGTKQTPYVESDATNPLNTYGQTKLEGDLAIAGSGTRFLILRVSWVYSSRGRNFLLTMLRLAREGKPLRVVDDQYGAPTTSSFIAEVTHGLIARAESAQGLFHVAPSGKTSWCGFARAIMQTAGFPNEVTPITADEFPAPARRPKNSLLATESLRSFYQVALPSWQQGLRQVMRELPNAQEA